jgi:hypothetical protein
LIALDDLVSMMSKERQMRGGDSTNAATSPSGEPSFANENKGLNLIPIASMAGGWTGPLLIFWLYVLGPLRPFHYPTGDLTPAMSVFAGLFVACVSTWWLPSSYFRVRSFERTGRIYEVLGVRIFRWFVPDGDLANRWRRRSEPDFKIIRNRRLAAAFVRRTQLSEKSHVVVLFLGLISAAYAWQIGWRGWAAYLALGNVLVNLYPILLQRYTRARLLPIVAARRRLGRSRGTASSIDRPGAR